MNHDHTPEYAAVRHILTSPAIRSRTAAFIGDDGFDWDGLLVEQQTMSGGERLLVLIARDLWEASGVVGVSDIVRRLDGNHFARVIDALSMSRADLPVTWAESARAAA
jgi:hypothetical protein